MLPVKMNKTIWVILSYVILILIIVTSSLRYSRAQASSDYYKSNYIAQNDTLELYKNKAGESTGEIAMYKVTAKDLKKVNEDLYKELQQVKGKKNVTLISKGEIEFRVCTLYVDSSEVIELTDSTKLVKRFYRDSRVSFDANIYLRSKCSAGVDSFFITDLITSTSVTTAVEEEKGVSNIIMSSNTPGATIKGLSGAEIVNKKLQPKSRLALGVNLGYGVYYDVAKDRGGHGLISGVGLTYNIIRFGRK